MVQLSGVIYENGGPLEAGWLSFYVLWGAAALHPSMRSMVDPAETRARAFPRGRLALLGGASLMAPAVQAVQALRHNERVDAFTIGGSFALFLLVVARMAGIVRKHGYAEARERALREAGASFVAATGRKHLYQAAVDATRRLVDPFAEVRLVIAGAPQEESAGNGSTSPVVIHVEAIPPWMTRAVGSDHLGEIRLLDPEARDLLGLNETVKMAQIAPLRMGPAIGGVLVLAGNSPLPHQVSDGVKALASQIALALESELLTEDLHRRQSEARFSSLVQNSSDVITLIDRDFTIRYQSPSSSAVLGHEATDIVGGNFLDYVHPDDRPRLVGFFSEVVGRKSIPDMLPFRWRHRDGTWLYMEATVSDLTADPNVAGIVLNTRDVTERTAFEEQLSHQAFHDALTGLANRKLFRDRVEHALERQRRDDRPIGVLFVDVDDFKTINDSLGHVAGDRLLQEIAERLKAALRTADTASRLGGDEFAILLEDAGYTRAAEVAERVMSALEAPFRLEGHEVFVRVSIGIAIGDEDRAGMGRAEDLLRNADVAMYTAKGQGKGRYQVFEEEMHLAVRQRLEMRADLQRAVEHGDFVLHYQPVVELRTGSIIGVEALLRWEHPRRGLVLPLEFISLAEESGLIVPIERWVLEEACDEGARLQSEFPREQPLTMAVNLSPRHFQDHDLVSDVESALRKTGIAPASLVLEITETVMMQDADAAALRLEELRGLGVRIAVDDFGTGYSSLSYLRRFPLDIIKVDKSFIDEVADLGDKSPLTAAVLQLAQNLQLVSVAEGIEREDQLSRLRELQCELGQGFLFARPVDTTRLRGLIKAGLAVTQL
jgi:diguanylate cyclase (GGDEF)-like protein/PAS domain S-box-containing protein